MPTIRHLLRQAADDYKGLIAIGGAFMLGATLAVATLGFTGQVADLSVSVESIELEEVLQEERIDRIEAALERLTTNVCILTKIESGESVLGC